MSAGAPRAPVRAPTRWALGSGPRRAVAMRPGDTQFTVTLSAARSWASARVSPTSPALAVTTCARRPAPGAEMGGQAADVDDCGGAARAQVRQAGLGADERAVEND